MLARMWRKEHPSIAGGIVSWYNHSGNQVGGSSEVGHSTTGRSSIYPEDIPAGNKNTCFTMFIAALFKIARSRKEPRCPSTEEWIQKMYIYTMEYYSAIKINEFMKFLGKWMYLEDIILSEVTQSQKNTHDMHSLISGYWPRSSESF